MLDQEEQDAATSESEKRRMITFATNIAETSVTLPGLEFVVDSGVEKVNGFDPVTRTATLEEHKISALQPSSARDERVGWGRYVFLGYDIGV